MLIWEATISKEEWDKLTDEELDELCEKLDDAWAVILEEAGLV